MSLHGCPDCHCGSPGEAFAPRPATSSEWARREALRAAEAAVRAAKDARKKPAELDGHNESGDWMGGPIG